MMADDDKPKPTTPDAPKRDTTEKALIFISHDVRDGELAEAFSKLLTSVSAGVLKSFRSSDRKGAQGIEYGVEWFPELMKQLDKASDVVCLLTPRSIDRPWILYEAGVAKGKLQRSVLGVALGIPFNMASTGPFAQFQNCDDDEESLTKLVMQLVQRIPDSEPDHDDILLQVKTFKSKADKVLARLGGSDETADQDRPLDNSTVAKLFEEVKVMFRDLPSRLESGLGDEGRIKRRPRFRRFHPMMIEDMIHMGGGKRPDPALAILMFASFFRDDAPWLYELGLEAYRAARSGSSSKARAAMRIFQRVAEFTARGPFMEEMGMPSEEMHMMLMETPRIIEHYMNRAGEPEPDVQRDNE
ncbi:MAG: toll/interleukin-1 receptor domain-containing protein [Planctomycetes bacterium]|nr:toll/interleukin-1 receptor domain-containing protein [Planctomycetota bacterium]